MATPTPSSCEIARQDEPDARRTAILSVLTIRHGSERPKEVESGETHQPESREPLSNRGAFVPGNMHNVESASWTVLALGGRAMLAEEARKIAEHQRHRFNELVDIFDKPQPLEVMTRLREIVASAGLRPGEVVLDVGTGVGVLIPLIQPYRPSTVSACDVAEKMLQRVHEKYPAVRTYHCDITLLALACTSVDTIFMNGMYGNIADKPAACRNAARLLRPGGRLVVSHPEGRAFVDQLRAASDLFIESLPSRKEFEVLLEPLGFEVILYRDEPKLYLTVARKN